MSVDLVNIEIDGKPVQARKGQMIIHATDAVDRYVPRFCYHEKLSIAANCRMCLVEVEKAPKPLPACATPVAEGMKIFTRSPRAIAAQKATMEFLLINHPLDCPICDQGGECELQDLALGYGSASSRFDERKRVVKDKNLGPLISTDMTRCIHCTRCVRFTSEIAGLQELGTTGRGENMEIGTWIERSVNHELSGNVIDLCPVGALNSKPFRHRARSWEMTEHALVSPHDAVGSNLYGHVLRGRLLRVVPRQNDEINETWIADRDRFSYEGVYAEDRLETPMVRSEGQLRPATWEQALDAVAQGLKQAGASTGFLSSPGATTEEHYLLARIARGLGSSHVDHRLRQTDFRDQQHDPAFLGLGISLQDIESLDAMLLIGCQLRQEAPMLAHRVRKAAIANGARVSLLSSQNQECHFPVAGELVAKADRWVDELAGILRAVSEAATSALPGGLSAILASAPAEPRHHAAAQSLLSGTQRWILLGAEALRHSQYADLRALAAALAAATGAKLGYLTEGANAAGAALAGALPHRLAGGKPTAAPGQDAHNMFSSGLKAGVLFGGIEPESDLRAEAAAALGKLEFLVAITPFGGGKVGELADIVLPIGSFAETSGTYVNAEGRWQSFRGCATPLGEARPGWKVLRVLGNLLGLEGFDYQSSEEVLAEVRQQVGEPRVADHYCGQHTVERKDGGETLSVSIYDVDAIVRRAPALQATKAAGG